MRCNKNHQHKFDKKLKEQFFNTNKFSNHENNNFILWLQKCVYPYEYMDDWEKLNETSLTKKEDFGSHLIMEDITDDADYANAKRVILSLHYCYLMYLRTFEMCV